MTGLDGISDTYRLLARLWLRELDLDTLQLLCAGDVANAFQQVGGRLPTAVTNAEVDALAEDYCQLFVGPKNHLPPYQSVWVTGQFQQESITSMLRYGEVLGDSSMLSIDGTMPDHLGIQLQVMAQLTTGPAQSVEGRSQQQAREDICRWFFVDHLSWTKRLTRAARCRARTDFYRSVTEMTERFLDVEQRFLFAETSRADSMIE